MKRLTKTEKEKILLRLFWDVKPGNFNFDDLLVGDTENLSSVEEQNVYRRLLMSCDWYTLLKILPHSKIKTILNSPVVEGLYPKDLRKRFFYARDVLSRLDLSTSNRWCPSISKRDFVATFRVTISIALTNRTPLCTIMADIIWRTANGKDRNGTRKTHTGNKRKS